MALWRDDTGPGGFGGGSAPDDGGAGDLADQLEQLAAAWEQGSARRWDEAAVARRSWRGRAAGELDRELAHQRDASDQLVELLRTEARVWRAAAEARAATMAAGPGPAAASDPVGGSAPVPGLGWRP